jgi:hypothetical protein
MLQDTPCFLFAGFRRVTERLDAFLLPFPLVVRLALVLTASGRGRPRERCDGNVRLDGRTTAPEIGHHNSCVCGLIRRRALMRCHSKIIFDLASGLRAKKTAHGSAAVVSAFCQL